LPDFAHRDGRPWLLDIVSTHDLVRHMRVRRITAGDTHAPHIAVSLNEIDDANVCQIAHGKLRDVRQRILKIDCREH
jgi:hypothetical protein